MPFEVQIYWKLTLKRPFCGWKLISGGQCTYVVCFSKIKSNDRDHQQLARNATESHYHTYEKFSIRYTNVWWCVYIYINICVWLLARNSWISPDGLIHREIDMLSLNGWYFEVLVSVFFLFGFEIWIQGCRWLVFCGFGFGGELQFLVDYISECKYI